MKSAKKNLETHLETKEAKEQARQKFWDKKCQNEPGHLGCKIYDL